MVIMILVTIVIVLCMCVIREPQSVETGWVASIRTEGFYLRASMPDTDWNLGLRLFTVYSTVELRGFLQKNQVISRTKG